MINGPVLISPDDMEDYFAFFVKSQIVDHRLSKVDDRVRLHNTFCQWQNGRNTK
jgi:hypothetical protein